MTPDDFGVNKSKGVDTLSGTHPEFENELSKGLEGGITSCPQNSSTEKLKANSVTDDVPSPNQIIEDTESRINEKVNDLDSIPTIKDTAKSTETFDSAVPEKNTASTTVSKKAEESTSSAPPLRAPVKKRSSQLGSMARKKRKRQLADMSAAVTSTPVKMNTLEKSKLDWEAFKGNIATEDNRSTMSAAERDELDSQTQGGGSGLGDVKGYLHRKEFLDRVHGRLDQQEYENLVSK